MLPSFPNNEFSAVGDSFVAYATSVPTRPLRRYGSLRADTRVINCAGGYLGHASRSGGRAIGDVAKTEASGCIGWGLGLVEKVR